MLDSEGYNFRGACFDQWMASSTVFDHGLKIKWLWAGRIITGSMSRVCMDGKKGAYTRWGSDMNSNNLRLNYEQASS